MTDKNFDAILAKNEIARELKRLVHDSEPINTAYVIERLKEIEKFIGEGNQPCVEDIITCTKFDL